MIQSPYSPSQERNTLNIYNIADMLYNSLETIVPKRLKVQTQAEPIVSEWHTKWQSLRTPRVPDGTELKICLINNTAPPLSAVRCDWLLWDARAELRMLYHLAPVAGP